MITKRFTETRNAAVQEGDLLIRPITLIDEGLIKKLLKAIEITNMDGISLVDIEIKINTNGNNIS